jgi:hypothetical protein
MSQTSAIADGVKPVKSTILDGMHNGRNWVAVLSCGDRVRYDRRPLIGRVISCAACTAAHELTPERIRDMNSRMDRLSRVARLRAKGAIEAA